MKFILVLILAIILPIFTFFATPHLIPLIPSECRADTTIIDNDGRESVINSGEWHIEHALGRDVGYYAGKLTVVDSSGSILINENVYRSFSTKVTTLGQQVQTVTVSASRLTKDNLPAELEEKYLPRLMQNGNITISSVFRLSGGTVLSGLPKRPRLVCKN